MSSQWSRYEAALVHLHKYKYTWVCYSHLIMCITAPKWCNRRVKFRQICCIRYRANSDISVHLSIRTNNKFKEIIHCFVICYIYYFCNNWNKFLAFTFARITINMLHWFLYKLMHEFYCYNPLARHPGYALNREKCERSTWVSSCQDRNNSEFKTSMTIVYQFRRRNF